MDSCIAMGRPPPSLGLSFRIRWYKGPSEGLRLCFVSLVSWNRAMCISFWAGKSAISGAFPEIPLQVNWRILRMPFDCWLWELLQRGLWASIGCGNCYLVRGGGWGFASGGGGGGVK